MEMTLVENISLRPYNSFGIEVVARYYSTFSSEDELRALLDRQPKLPRLILGGGSNLLFTHDYDGLVCRNTIRGILELHEDSEYVYVKAGAGENWHQFVQYCIGKDWGGLENLSLIPGNVGAAPIQNIGAYGVELEDVFWLLEAYHLKDHTLQTFTRSDCEFGYRNSIFKKSLKGQFAILNVTFRLCKKPVLHTSYGTVSRELERMGVVEPTIRSISEAVISIRKSKLPDPAILGNAGSFFKNPVVSAEKFDKLKTQFPEIVAYPAAGEGRKLAAAWLIEQCGWKGYRRGDAGCHERQPLVLVNFGRATGAEIFQLSEEIARSVKDKFDVELEREVNVI